MNWYFGALKKYVVFSGRARRKEYWYYTLFNMIIFTVFYALAINGAMNGNNTWMAVAAVYALLTLLPSLSVTIRRLHDTDRSGWWFLIAFVPIVSIVLLVFMFFDSTPGTNQFGPNPKEA